MKSLSEKRNFKRAWFSPSKPTDSIGPLRAPGDKGVIPCADLSTQVLSLMISALSKPIVSDAAQALQCLVA